MNLFLPPTASEWTLLIVLFCAISLFIAAAEAIRRYRHGSPEVTRKLVHILTGVLIFFAPDLFHSGIPAILLAVAFIIINFTAVRMGLLKGLHGTNRRSYGTVYYPFSFLLLVLLCWDSAPYLISIPILVLAFADAAAAIVGENLSRPHLYHLTTDKKSLEGTTAMILTSAATILIAIHYFHLPYSGGAAAGVALVAALYISAWEAISSKGFDNLTIPLSAAWILHYCTRNGTVEVPDMLLLGLLFGIGIAIVSLRFRLLTPSGSVAVMLLATLVYGAGGWQWTVPILTFFITSSVISKIRGGDVAGLKHLFDKSDQRDEGQVAANGGVAGAIVLLWYFSQDSAAWFPVYAATLAAVAADTWSTEIGTRASKRAYSIVSMKRVPRGTSGGVSIIGVAGGIAGSAAVAVSAWAMSPELITGTLLLKVIAAGTIGAVTDSLLGATVQAIYRSLDGTITERQENETGPNELLHGYRWIDNDIVNWACALTGAAAMYLML